MPRLVDDLLLFAAFLTFAAFIYIRRPALRFVAAFMVILALVQFSAITIDAPIDKLVPQAIRNLVAVIWLFVSVIGFSIIGYLRTRRQLVR